METDVKQVLAPETVEFLRQQLSEVREPWKSSRLVERVSQLVSVDHNCACQKLFNTAIWDIKDKLSHWGEEFVYKIANAKHSFSRVNENPISGLSTTELLNLSYRSKLLSSEQLQLLIECYQIRCKLEHEDRYFEVSSLETEKFFDVCVNEVLNVERIEIKEFDKFESLPEHTELAVPSQLLLNSFGNRSIEHQIDVIVSLIELATNSTKLKRVNQNSNISLIHLQEYLSDAAKHTIAKIYSDPKIQNIDSGLVESLKFADVLRFIVKSSKSKFYKSIYITMTDVGKDWNKGQQQWEILQSFIELGSLNECPLPDRNNIFHWLALTYIGQDDGKSAYISERDVYFSKEAAPVIRKLIKESNFISEEMIFNLLTDSEISFLIENPFISDRFERFLQLSIENRKIQ